MFEQADYIGGRARSDTVAGCVVDTGAQLFGSGFSTLFNVARGVGAEKLLVQAPGRDALYRNGRIHPITYGSVASMVTSGALPAALKFKLGAKYVPFLLRNAGMLDASDPVARGSDWLDTESAAEWGTRELGRDFVELLAYPLLGAYYGSEPERTSAAMYHALAKAGLDVGVYAVQGGTGALMSAIADAATARGATLRIGTRVERVARIDDAFEIATSSGSDIYDAIIIAVPAPVVHRLFELPTIVRDWMETVQYSPSAVLAVVLNQPANRDFFGLSLLRDDALIRDLVAICNQSQKLPSLVPANKGLLLCLSAPAASAELIADGQSAVPRMLDALERVLPGTRARIEHVKLYRHTHAYPVFYPGYLKHLRKFPSTDMPRGVQLAGDYLVAPTVEGALRSGLRAAEALFA